MLALLFEAGAAFAGVDYGLFQQCLVNSGFAMSFHRTVMLLMGLAVFPLVGPRFRGGLLYLGVQGPGFYLGSLGGLVRMSSGSHWNPISVALLFRTWIFVTCPMCVGQCQWMPSANSGSGRAAPKVWMAAA